MLEPEELIRTCLAELSAEQERFALQVDESLAALDTYQSHLEQWEQQLAQQAERVQQQNRLVAQELQQDAEDDEGEPPSSSSQQLAQPPDSFQPPTEIPPPPPSPVTEQTAYPLATGDTVATVAPRVGGSAMAQQLQKLRQQQAARRST